MPGRLISFEGVDGVGKTSQLALLAQKMREEGYNILCTKEPGSPADASNLGVELRHIMFQTVKTHNMARGVVDCLLLADHVQHVEKVIKPMLAEGKTILTDRYADSEFAYSVAKNTPISILDAYTQLFGPIPDITVLFIAENVKLMLERARARKGDSNQAGKSWDDSSLQIRIQQEYINRLVGQKRTIVLNIDADKSPDQIFVQDLWPSIKFALDADRYKGFEHLDIPVYDHALEIGGEG